MKLSPAEIFSGVLGTPQVTFADFCKRPGQQGPTRRSSHSSFWEREEFLCSNARNRENARAKLVWLPPPQGPSLGGLSPMNPLPPNSSFSYQRLELMTGPQASVSVSAQLAATGCFNPDCPVKLESAFSFTGAKYIFIFYFMYIVFTTLGGEREGNNSGQCPWTLTNSQYS